MHIDTRLYTIDRCDVLGTREAVELMSRSGTDIQDNASRGLEDSIKSRRDIFCEVLAN
jgi:hypothetical protein